MSPKVTNPEDELKRLEEQEAALKQQKRELKKKVLEERKRKEERFEMLVGKYAAGLLTEDQRRQVLDAANAKEKALIREFWPEEQDQEQQVGSVAQNHGEY